MATGDAPRSMRPVDPRLAALPPVRRYLLVTAGFAVAAGALVVAQASALADMLTRAATGQPLAAPLALTAGVVAIRAGHRYAQQVAAARAAADVKAMLRSQVLERTSAAGPVTSVTRSRGELATLVTRGLDALDPYLTGYLPQLFAAVAIPVAVLARLSVADLVSALVIAVTLPLIPVFAILVGAHTRARTRRRWRTLERLGGHFLDVVAGLPTLRVFGRAQVQVAEVRRVADTYRGATMRTLRVAFLSALVLELVATLSVALVAVPVGLRLLDGDMTLATALLVLLLAPEAYAPLRAAGAGFHASVEGLTVAGKALDVPPPPPARTQARVPDVRHAAIRLDRVTAAYPGADRPALVDVSLVVRPGERMAVVGPSGAGKSTLLAVLLGFLPPRSGRVLVGDTDLSIVDLAAWRRQLAYVPQRPHLFAATVADNIRLGAPDATDEAVRAAARAAAADAFIAALPAGYDTRLDERGAGLSSGQRQRVALARAFLRDAPVLLLDEPTAGLDTESEAAIFGATSRLLADRTTIMVAHRPALLRAADRVLALHDGRLVPCESSQVEKLAKAAEYDHDEHAAVVAR